eukprot:CAMPEP_0194079072 /NCGR_PEP_ID=MMETSP0149-20130528/5304_1 /TAXON_ID=122233 /ORGANISM="Chaetoceros debilis, Strain MM31A-1" /LENGTH=528 /DNA_ID=CAMNT_0038760441 /DNA_START=77 /DNA_END=1663 /DNA_ORIENTATION=+
MSVFDIMGSLAMAFTSILMPKEMPLEEELGLLSWPGARYGNTFTCNVQGFLATFGPTCMVGYNIGLCQYYAFAIAFRMKEENIRKYIQPFILIVPIFFGFALALPPLFYELYNPPSHLGAAWCIATTYPTINCTDDTCIRGKQSVQEYGVTLVKATSGMGAILIFVSLALVVFTVCFRPSENIEISRGEDQYGLENDNVCTHTDANAVDDVNAGMDSIPLGENLDIGSNTTPSFNVSRALSSSKSNQYITLADPKNVHYDLGALRTKPVGESINELDDIFYAVETSYSVNGAAYRHNRDRAILPTGRHYNQSKEAGQNDLSPSIEEDSNTSLETDEQREEARVRTEPKVVVMQAIAYLIAFALTIIWTVFLSKGSNDEEEIVVVKMWAFKTSLFLFPLHGFFNLVIFLCHKVYNYRRMNANESICNVLKLLFSTPLQEPCFITRISVVEKYEVANAFLVSNEMGDRTIIRKSALEHSESSESSPGFLLELQSGESFVEDSCNKENFSVTSNFSPCILSSYVYCNRPSE